MYKSNTGCLANYIDELEKQRRDYVFQKSNINQVKRSEINQNAKAYHSELLLQQEERNRQKKLHKLNEQVAGLEHTKKWSDWVCYN